MSSITDDEAMDVSQDSGPLEQTSESSLQSSEINSTIYIGRMDTSQDTKGPKTTSEISRESIEIKSIVESETTEILEEAPSFGYMNVMLQREDTGHGIETYMKEISLPIAATWSEIASILRRHAPTVDKHGKITGQGFGKWMHVLVCNDIETVVEDSACVLDSDEAYEKFVEKLQDSDIKTAIVVRHSTYHGYTKQKLAKLQREGLYIPPQKSAGGAETGARNNFEFEKPNDRPERFPMFSDDPENSVPEMRPLLD